VRKALRRKGLAPQAWRATSLAHFEVIRYPVQRNFRLELQSVGMTFEWDARKAAANLRKHGVAFEEAATVFHDPLAMTFPDPDHSEEERREITVGCTIKGRMVFLAHCERGSGLGS